MRCNGDSKEVGKFLKFFLIWLTTNKLSHLALHFLRSGLSSCQILPFLLLVIFD